MNVLKLTLRSLILVFGCFCVSCVNDIAPPLTETEVVNVIQKRSLDDAKEIAGQYVDLLSEGKGLSREASREIKSVNVLGSRCSRADADTLLYIVNFADDQGFVLVTALKSSPAVLAFSDSGEFDTVNINPNLKCYLDASMDFIKGNELAAQSEISQSEGFRLMWKTDTLTNYWSTGPRVPVQYGQAWPENYYCPNKIAGCGPIAIAQILTYFKPEFNRELTFYCAPRERLNIEWEEFLKHKKSTNVYQPDWLEENAHYENCQGSLKIHDDLALLVREIGELSKANYTPTGTSTYASDLKSTLYKLLPGKEVEYVDASQFYNKVKDTGVMELFGSRTGAGHTWVCDGVGQIGHQIITYYNYDPVTREYDSKEEKYESYNYLHHNWGWAGASNGYFLDGVFDTSKSTGGFLFAPSRANYNQGNFGYYIH